jgi:phospholipase C
LKLCERILEVRTTIGTLYDERIVRLGNPPVVLRGPRIVRAFLREALDDVELTIGDPEFEKVLARELRVFENVVKKGRDLAVVTVPGEVVVKLTSQRRDALGMLVVRRHAVGAVLAARGVCDERDAAGLLWSHERTTFCRFIKRRLRVTRNMISVTQTRTRPRVRRSVVNRLWAFAAVAALSLAGCSSSIATPGQVPATKPSSPPPSSKIQHVVILLQENRSFNTIFMGFPGAETATSGACKEYTWHSHGQSKTFCKGGQIVQLHSVTLESDRKPEQAHDISHSHRDFENEFDLQDGVPLMDGFDTLTNGTVGLQGEPAGTYPYAYVKRPEVEPYWRLASRYALADHVFSTATTDSFVAHQEIIAGTTRLNDHESLTDTPSNRPWGCDAPTGTVTGVIFSNGRVNDFGGPFPCFTQYDTMADVLDAAGVSWNYYVESYDISSPYIDFSGEVWNGFDAIKRVRRGPDWNKVAMPNTRIFDDVKNGKLPQVSWLIPCVRNSDHPAAGSNTGPAWVTSVVNAIGNSPYWNSTVIVVLWDDWGGWYDPVPPPQLDYTSLGFRVPMLVISPYAKPHFVSKTQYEFGSVLKFVEENFGTGSLGSTDVRANSIGDILDFKRSPRKFQPIGATTPPKCSYPQGSGAVPRNVTMSD